MWLKCKFMKRYLILFQVSLSPEDIEVILNLLIYDGKVERFVVASDKQNENKKIYRAVESLLPSAGLMRMPCGVCPVSSFLALICFIMKI